MTYGTVNADVVQSSVSGVSLGAGNASIMKNRIINGAMTVSQYNGSSSFTPVDSTYFMDRYQYIGSQASKLTAQQNLNSVTPPVGFANYLGFKVASAVTIGSGDYFGFRQKIEGYNFYDLQWGTANAKTVTLSFWVNSSVTGTYGGSLLNASQNRDYPFSYTINSANTWQQISITIAGDTSGTWTGATNGIGLEIDFQFGTGSSYSGTAGTWGSSLILNATGNTASFMATANATFYITGVQLEVGSSATGFEYRQYQQELALCQRYYQRSTNISSTTYVYLTNWGSASGTTSARFTYPLKVSLRSYPTSVDYANVGLDDNAAGYTVSSVGIWNTSAQDAVGLYANATGLTSYRPYVLCATVQGGYVGISAEL